MQFNPCKTHFNRKELGINLQESSTTPSQTYLLWLKVTDDCVNIVQDFINKWHDLSHLNLDKVSAAFLCYFYEGITSHVLDTVVGF